MASIPSITPVTTAQEVKLDLKDIATTEENQVITLYMMIPPTDLSKQSLKAVAITKEGVQEITFEGKNFISVLFGWLDTLIGISNCLSVNS